MGQPRWLRIHHPLSPRARLTFGLLSFVLPVTLWCLISYVPFLWHPDVRITDPGSVSYLDVGSTLPRAGFAAEVAAARAQGQAPPRGVAANPIYLPTPLQVFAAFYRAFSTPPPTRDGPWLHQSLWHSIQVIFWGYVISSAIGVPLGVLCGAYAPIARMCEPFIEFFRYLPAPAFGALAVAILGIYDGPKIAIIVIGTFFQQVLIIANTTRKLDPALLEAALTLGTRNRQLLTRVVVPGVLPELYRDQRVLLGWAW
ncbi:MAG TPA: ABC transporter permease subunit, partial [Steroidobacteraceae bacterium]|nr:ABC transporter permease subunit [Steroidobacteraceae bacterium]